MDSLLGIGTDGGTSKGEGKALASRLTQMRKERNERAAKTATPAKKEEMKPLSPPTAFGGGPAGEMTLQGLDDRGDMGEMELVTPSGGGGTSKKKSNNNKKKKKKRKKKK